MVSQLVGKLLNRTVGALGIRFMALMGRMETE